MNWLQKGVVFTLLILRHLEGGASCSNRQDLMSKADAKNRLENGALLHELLQVVDQLFTQRWITRTVAQEQSVILVLERIFVIMDRLKFESEKLLYPLLEASSTAPLPPALLSWPSSGSGWFCRRSAPCGFLVFHLC